MLTSAGITIVKTATSHDSDDQVSTTQFVSWFQLEQDRIRTKLALAIPSLYTSTQTSTLTSTTTISKPNDFLALVRFEKLVGSRYFTVGAGEGLSTHGLEGLQFREEATNFEVSPTEDAPGTYRMTYVTQGTTLATDASTALQVPLGLEDVLIERVAARTRERCLEDPSSHYKRAEEIWKEIFPAIKKRFGRHPVQGLRRVRGDV